jgi:hypothetical protein
LKDIPQDSVEFERYSDGFSFKRRGARRAFLVAAPVAHQPYQQTLGNCAELGGFTLKLTP